MVMEGDLALGGEHTIQHTAALLQNCTPETCIILSTNVTPICSTEKKKQRDDRGKPGKDWHHFRHDPAARTHTPMHVHTHMHAYAICP